jgi:hypothetical protein
MLLLAAGNPAVAQRAGVSVPPSEIARADALLRAGRVDAAEAMYYRAARRRPRDPAARLALGRYLASRGATRIGAVLIEEARFFGTSPVVAAVHLAPLYSRLGDYKALALLPAAPIGASERLRAEWLVKNPATVTGPDSATLPLAAASSESGAHIGTIVLTINGTSVHADIDPTARGLVLDTSYAASASIRLFTSEPPAVQAGVAAIPAVVPRAQLGPLVFTNLPVSIEPLGTPSRARIGLDLLGRFSPTFRPHDGQLVLRRLGKVAKLLAGERVPLVLEARDAWVVWEGRREALAEDAVMRRLRGARWTLDARRGVIVLQS